MQVSKSIEIAKPVDVVWSVITDIENSINVVSSILDIEILSRPEDSFVGFKWKETRKFCGKEASEIMWVTDSQTNQYYVTRAESHGSVYISRVFLEESSGGSRLTISFTGEPQTLVARFLTFIMSPFIQKSLHSELAKDLLDIKNHIERIEG